MDRILLIEDNPVDAQFIQRVFAESGDWQSEVTWLDDGEKALWFLRSLEEQGVANPPDLVILDLNLPKYDGLEVLAAFRQSPSAWSLPVFLFSSAPSEAIQALAEQNNLRAEGYFEKPYSLHGYKEIARAIRHYLETATPHPIAAATAFEFTDSLA